MHLQGHGERRDRHVDMTDRLVIRHFWSDCLQEPDVLLNILFFFLWFSVKLLKMCTDTVCVCMSNVSVIIYASAAPLHHCSMKTERDQNLMLLFLRPPLLRVFFFLIVELLLLLESKNVALTYLTTFFVV